jgi:hypothetical protein
VVIPAVFGLKELNSEAFGLLLKELIDKFNSVYYSSFFLIMDQLVSLKSINSPGTVKRRS